MNVEYTGGEIKEMVVVTGGCGYIGSHMVKVLQEMGEKVIVIDNLETGHEWAIENVKFYNIDLKDKRKVLDVFKENRFEIKGVFHFAASSIVSESMKNPHKYFENNLVGAINLVKAMIETNVKYIVFSSTAAVYGEPKTVPITEDQEKKPTNVYGESKLMIEKILDWFSKLGYLNYVALRYFNAAGAHPSGTIGEAHDPETHLIPIVLQTALGLREKVVVYGNDYPTHDGTPIRDYIHVMDLIDAHVKAMDWMMKNNKSDVFNLGNGKGFTVLEVIETAKKVTGVDINYEIGKRREGDPAVLVASSEKAKKVLNWQPKYPELEIIISDAWRWHKNYLEKGGK